MDLPLCLPSGDLLYLSSDDMHCLPSEDFSSIFENHFDSGFDGAFLSGQVAGLSDSESEMSMTPLVASRPAWLHDFWTEMEQSPLLEGKTTVGPEHNPPSPPPRMTLRPSPIQPTRLLSSLTMAAVPVKRVERRGRKPAAVREVPVTVAAVKTTVKPTGRRPRVKGMGFQCLAPKTKIVDGPLFTKKLTEYDCKRGGILIPRKPSRKQLLTGPMIFEDHDDGSRWMTEHKVWRNKSPIHVLEHMREYLKPYNLQPGDQLRFYRSRMGHVIVERRYQQQRALVIPQRAKTASVQRTKTVKPAKRY